MFLLEGTDVDAVGLSIRQGCELPGPGGEVKVIPVTEPEIPRLCAVIRIQMFTNAECLTMGAGVRVSLVPTEVVC